MRAADVPVEMDLLLLMWLLTPSLIREIFSLRNVELCLNSHRDNLTKKKIIWTFLSTTQRHSVYRHRGGKTPENIHI